MHSIRSNGLKRRRALGVAQPPDRRLTPRPTVASHLDSRRLARDVHRARDSTPRSIRSKRSSRAHRARARTRAARAARGIRKRLRGRARASRGVRRERTRVRARELEREGCLRVRGVVGRERGDVGGDVDRTRGERGVGERVRRRVGVEGRRGAEAGEIDPVRGAENNDGRAVGAESAAHGIGARVIREFRHRIERTDAERGDETRDV